MMSVASARRPFAVSPFRLLAPAFHLTYVRPSRMKPNADGKLAIITAYLNESLDIPAFPDYPNAFNGLQLENSGRVTRVGAAVDSGLKVIEMAIAQGVDLLLVHHGLFWGGCVPISGPTYTKLAKAIGANLAVYSAHLPLDAHPEIGNNVLLAAELGLGPVEAFFEFRGRSVGCFAQLDIGYADLLEKIEHRFGRAVWHCDAGPERVRKVGIVTGGAGSELAEAKAQGIDTFITGEGPHHTFTLAEELGMNLVYAGHYATETAGVKALADRVANRFGLSWVFLDHPSGL
jgi:dinuclear metal center YbgI/SA1388 family protein